MGVLSGLKPEKVFYYFEELCKIPHGSYHTKQISDYLVSFAKEHELEKNVTWSAVRMTATML